MLVLRVDEHCFPFEDGFVVGLPSSSEVDAGEQRVIFPFELSVVSVKVFGYFFVVDVTVVWRGPVEYDCGWSGDEFEPVVQHLLL